MIDIEAFERLNVTDRQYAKQSLILLNRSGVLLNQLNIEHEKLVDGPDDEPASQVAHRVIKYRQTVTHLRTLTELAAQFEKEESNG